MIDTMLSWRLCRKRLFWLLIVSVLTNSDIQEYVSPVSLWLLAISGNDFVGIVFLDISGGSFFFSITESSPRYVYILMKALHISFHRRQLRKKSLNHIPQLIAKCRNWIKINQILALVWRGDCWIKISQLKYDSVHKILRFWVMFLQMIHSAFEKSHAAPGRSLICVSSWLSYSKSRKHPLYRTAHG